MAAISVRDQIYLAVSYRRTTLSAVAREMGMTQQNLCRKIAQNTLKEEDIDKIAEILGGEYISYFSFPDGVFIGDIPPKKKKRG